ncbi:MAG TPA: DUF3300 domain-containing protein [Tepidisphaeraceae bacterium]|nr:DUF3300 domain-containing protein [Tepidisphaeraceae bacterium]
MKQCKAPRTIMSVILMMLGATAFQAHGQYDPGPAPPAAVLLDAADMEQLVAPIALYPDPLLAQVFAASTYPLEIQAVANWMQANPNPSEAAIAAQAVEPSVQALLHYPAVLLMMNNEFDWTQQLGVCFLNQQADVMSAVQRLRARAQYAGALVSGPQQQVMTDPDGIEILPTEDNVLYVPEYDPDAVYVGDGGHQAYITFSTGYPSGLWLNYDLDWHDRRIGVGGGWNHGWDRRHDRERPVLRPWERDHAKPLPVLRRGADGQAWRSVRPGYEKPDAARPAAGAFGGYQKSADVQRNVARTQQSRGVQQPAARQVRPAAPQARPAAPQERPAVPQARPAATPQERPASPQARPAAPQARPAAPQVRPAAPQARPAAPSAFRGAGNGHAVAAQSARGHTSMGSSGGGGKAGGRK